MTRLVDELLTAALQGSSGWQTAIPLPPPQAHHNPLRSLKIMQAPFAHLDGEPNDFRLLRRPSLHSIKILIAIY